MPRLLELAEEQPERVQQVIVSCLKHEHPSGHIVIFKTDDGKVSVDARFDAETAWLSLDQMAALFERDKSTVSRHIRNVFEEGELNPEGSCCKNCNSSKSKERESLNDR